MSRIDDLEPENGARLTLTRVSVSDAAACYQVDVQRADGRHDRTALTLHTSPPQVGPLALQAPAGWPAWLERQLQALARQVLQRATQHTPPLWPRRVHRWRAEAR